MSECHLSEDVDIFPEAGQKRLPHVLFQTTSTISFYYNTQFLKKH